MHSLKIKNSLKTKESAKSDKKSRSFDPKISTNPDNRNSPLLSRSLAPHASAEKDFLLSFEEKLLSFVHFNLLPNLGKSFQNCSY